jgi:hypothetical protein
MMPPGFSTAGGGSGGMSGMSNNGQVNNPALLGIVQAAQQLLSAYYQPLHSPGQLQQAVQNLQVRILGTLYSVASGLNKGFWAPSYYPP